TSRTQSKDTGTLLAVICYHTVSATWLTVKFSIAGRLCRSFLAYCWMYYLPYYLGQAQDAAMSQLSTVQRKYYVST
ncbi:hypothetical protein EDC04DRAFT_2694020, partial [Pisolithus marmoratus]